MDGRCALRGFKSVQTQLQSRQRECLGLAVPLQLPSTGLLLNSVGWLSIVATVPVSLDECGHSDHV